MLTISVLFDAGRYGSGRNCSVASGPVPSGGTPKDWRAGGGAMPGIMSRASRPGGTAGQAPGFCAATGRPGQPDGPVEAGG